MGYVGIPYKDKGRDRNGCDCYGLVKLFYKEEYGITLKDYDYYDPSDMDKIIRENKNTCDWTEVSVEEIQRGDILVLKQFGADSHVGVCLDKKWFVHCESGVGSGKELIHMGRWATRIVSCHRYRSVSVLLKPSIISEESITKQYVAGLTLQEIVDDIVPEDRREKVELNVCGNIVPRSIWTSSTPKPGARIFISDLPKGGSRDLLRAILSVAVLAYSAGGGGYFFNELLGIGLNSAQAGIGVGIASMLGMMAVTALIPPVNVDDNTTVDETQAYGLTSGSNRINKFGPVPDVHGTDRFHPPYAARYFTELRGSDQWLHCVFSFGHGTVNLAEEKIGDTDLTNFEDYEEEYGVTPAIPTIVTDNIVQEPISADLEFDTEVIRTTQADVEAFGIDVYAPQGFTQFHDNGSAVEAVVYVTIDVAPTGTSAWTLPASTGYVRDVTIGTAGTFAGGGWKDIEFSGGNPEEPARARAFFNTFSNTLMSVELLHTGAGYKSAPTATIPGSTGCTLTVNYAVGLWSFRAESTDPKRWHIPLASKGDYAVGQYDIRVKRITADPTRESTRDQLVWYTINNYFEGNIINVDYEMTWKAFRFKATGQLNGNIDSYSALVTRGSSNPADAFIRVLQGPAIGPEPVPDSEIDLVTIAEWWTFCDDNNLIFNHTFEDTATVQERLAVICEAGRASLALPENKYSVIIEKAQDEPVTLLTPRNGSNFQGSMNYLELAHAIKCKWKNEDNNFDWESNTVYRDGYDSSNATIIEEYTFIGSTTWESVWRRARRMLATGEYDRENWTYEVDWEQLKCRRGDRVEIYHDVIDNAVGFGRIVGTGANYIELDETMTLDGATSYSMSIRSASEGILIVNLTAGQSGDVKQYLCTVPAGLIGDELVALYETSKGRTDGIIKKISAGENAAGTIVVGPYAPEIYTSDSGTVPPYVAPGSNRLGINPPRNLALNEYLYSENGRQVQGVTLYWQHAEDTIPDYYEVQILRPGVTTFSAAGTTETDSIRIPDTPVGNYSFRVRTKKAGAASVWEYLTDEVLSIASNPMPDVTGFQVNYRGNTATLSWDGVNDFRGATYDVRFGEDWDSAAIVSVQAGVEYVPGNNGTYLIKARSLDGESVSANTANVLVDGLSIETAVVHGPITEDWTSEGTYYANDGEWVGGPRGAVYRPPIFLPLWWRGELSGELDTDIWTVGGNFSYDAANRIYMNAGPDNYFFNGEAPLNTQEYNYGMTAVFRLEINMSVNASAIADQQFEWEILDSLVRCYSRNSNYEFDFILGSGTATFANPGTTVTFELINDRYNHRIELRANGTVIFSVSRVLNTPDGTYKIGVRQTQLSGATCLIYGMGGGVLPSYSPMGQDYVIAWYNNRKNIGYYHSDLSNRFINTGGNCYFKIQVDELLYHGNDEDGNILSVADILAMEDIFQNASSKAQIIPQCRVALNDGTPFTGEWSDWQNISNQRLYGGYADVRLKVITGEGYTVYIHTFKWSVVVEKRVEEGTLVISSPFPGLLTYSLPFNLVPNLQLTLVNANTGDVYQLLSETVNNFSVAIDNGGSWVTGSLNYRAEGF